jgi:hypothetical protein
MEKSDCVGCKQPLSKRIVCINNLASAMRNSFRRLIPIPL